MHARSENPAQEIAVEAAKNEEIVIRCDHSDIAIASQKMGEAVDC
jgi:hypothetical protein